MLVSLHLPRKHSELRDIPFEFIHDAFLPFDYPKRAFNDFPLRGHLNSTVIVGMGKWNGYFLVYRFSWKSGQIKYLPFYPSYKKEGKRLFLLYRDPFNPSEI